MTQLKWYDNLYGKGGDWSAFLEEDLARMLSFGFRALKSRTRGILLDVGCGAGGLLAKAREMGVSSVVGLDLSASALQRAKKHLRDADFVVANGLYPPFRGEAFDIITCNGTLEHFSNPKRGAELIYGMLSYGGAFVVAVPNPYFAYTLLCKALGKYRFQPIEHDLRFSSWRSLLESSGFKKVIAVPANPCSVNLLTAKSIPHMRLFYGMLRPLLIAYDRVRHSLPKFLSYHVLFVLEKTVNEP